MQEIAEKYGVNKATVSRVIAKARRQKCPFSCDCTKCKLPECAIKDEYAYLLNSVEDCREVKKRPNL